MWSKINEILIGQRTSLLKFVYIIEVYGTDLNLNLLLRLLKIVTGFRFKLAWGQSKTNID